MEIQIPMLNKPGRTVPPYLDPSVILLAEAENKKMARYIGVLFLFGVCGTGSKEMYCTIKLFLFKHKIVHSSNERLIIWLPELTPGIKALLGA